jgi:hypothetical protein
LTASGASGTIEGSILAQISPQPTGTGYLSPFLRIQSSGTATTSEGYNTSARPFEFDEKNPIVYTHDLLLSDVGVITIGGIAYREFLLDINEDSGHDDELLSLDRLMIFESDSGMRSGFPALGTLIWDLDAGGIDRWVKLDYSINHGSGTGDMAIYVPETVLSGLDYVYLYSSFGEHYGTSGGFEEWWTRESKRPNVPVPEPSLLVLFGLGTAAAAVRRRWTRAR